MDSKVRMGILSPCALWEDLQVCSKVHSEGTIILIRGCVIYAPSQSIFLEWEKKGKERTGKDTMCKQAFALTFFAHIEVRAYRTFISGTTNVCG